MENNKVRLDDVCERGSSNLAQKDITEISGDFPVYGASGYIKDVDFYHQEKEYVAVVKDGAGIGRTMFLPAKSSVIGTLQYLVPKENINPKYLYYAVTSMKLARYFTGATIPHIYFKDYKKEVLPLPDLKKQLEIVSILEKIEKMIEGKKVQLVEYDHLIKSRFVEMFGDPLLNNKKFDCERGEDIFKISNGKTIPAKERRDSGIPAYGGNGVSWYADDCLFEADTIVIGRVGFQSGNVHYVKGPLWITDNAMYVSKLYGDEYVLEFLFKVMEHINFQRFQDAGDLKKITQKPFMQMNYIKPPIALQNEYLEFLRGADKLKLEVQKSLDETQTLFDSLMQKYFE